MSEIRALLLTDVVDSTKLAESIGDAAMADVWAAHDRVARDLMQSHRGREIDKTDGMLVLFESAADAVSYALAYHRAIAALVVPLKARAGLHVGPVILRENSAADVALGAKLLEVDGLAKPIAARVMSLARGGQTLMTLEAREDLGRTELKIESHGHWFVKGVAEPIELFEVGEPGSRMVPPEDSDKVFRVVRAAEWWLPVREISNNLPYQATSLVGREKEVAEVKAFLNTARLLTVVGMGGMGKTRLCLQAAAELIHSFPDGVWFLDLSPLRDAALVVGEAAKVIGVHEEPDRPLLQALCAHLKQRRALVILDNCEHLIHAAAEFASAVLRAAPYVRIMASSREALHVTGEQCYPLHPLPLPDRAVTFDQLSHSPAVRLFVERAQQHRPSFAAGAAEAAGLAELVTRLEGIPLALELAAARVRSLSVADINARLGDRFKILTGGARVLQERQQTLRALVDWSYGLLNEPEQRLLARLGVFVGGFDLAAAEFVCGAEPLASDDVLDTLASLVEKSLVMLDESGNGGRYWMLETIRDYAREKLELSGESAATSVRHCEHYFVVAKQARDGMLGSEQAEWIRRIETDLDNVRSAFALALAGGVDPFIAVKLAVALQGFWELRGYATEGRSLIRSALALPAIQASELAQAWALYVGAGLAESQSDHAEAAAMLEECLTLRRRLANPVDVAATLSTLSLTRLRAGDVVGADEGEREALQIFRDLGDARGEAISLLHLSQVCSYLGDDDRARTHLEGCLSVLRATGNQELEGECELLLCAVALDSGDRTEAELRVRRSLSVCREAADTRGEGNALRWLGKCHLQNGDTTAARTSLGEALLAFRRFEMWEELLGCLQDFAELAATEGARAAAARIAGTVAALRQRRRLALSPREKERWEDQLTRLRQAMPADAFAAAFNDGSSRGVDEAIDYALTVAREPVVA
jgi:predicted ATPase/class 3 adenylate cyclase